MEVGCINKEELSTVEMDLFDLPNAVLVRIFFSGTRLNVATIFEKVTQLHSERCYLLDKCLRDIGSQQSYDIEPTP